MLALVRLLYRRCLDVFEDRTKRKSTDSTKKVLDFGGRVGLKQVVP